MDLSESFFHSARPPERWCLIEIQGPDARDFLQRLSTVHLGRLQPGGSSLGFFLTPQGKPISYFKLWMLNNGKYAFELDAGGGGLWKQRLLKGLERFHFGEQVEWKERSDLHCSWVFAEEASTGGPAEVPGSMCLEQGPRQFGRPWWSIWGELAVEAAYGDVTPAGRRVISEAQLLRWRIEAMGPAVDHEILETTLPLEVGLGGALAEDKGCYPGQEVIERIRSQGAPPRRMVLLRGSGDVPQAPTTLLIGDGAEIGVLTSCSSAEGQWIGLGLMRKQHALVGAKVQAGVGASGVVEQVSE